MTELIDDASFRARYGDWALIAGTSEGVGACFAQVLAERGLNLALLARSADKLEALADSLRTTGATVRAVVQDLSLPDAADRVADATAGLTVGMLVYCAGADPDYSAFLDLPIERSQQLVQRNCIVPMTLCHHFAGPMVERGRGGIILLSSAAGFAGSRNMVAYGPSKAFDMVMGEALWAELHDQGVDVLSLVLAGTDTPALRRLLLQRGAIANLDDEIPDLATPQQVVDEGLAHLTDGPTWLVGERLRETSQQLRAMTRSDAAKAMLRSIETSMMSRHAPPE